MKLGCVVCLLLCVIAYGQEMRLISFNETVSMWLPLSSVEKLSTAECGAGMISFMDITDTPHLGEKGNVNTVFPRIPGYPTHQDEVFPLIAALRSENVEETIRSLSSYQTRYYTSPFGEESARWLASQYESFIGSREDITVELWQHSAWRQPSIVARIEGSGPLANELVIIGGHIDSTSSGSVAPGADDDASGSSTVLEIFRVLATQGFRPFRTLEFHGYAAEEVGLRGSQDIAQYYLNQGYEVAGMLQLDMTGYVRAGTTPVIGTITDFTNPQLTAFVRNLAAEYATINWQNTACGYGCSDHASWFRAGYPSAFTFEGLFSNSNPYIHTVNDVLSRLDMEHSLEFAKLGVGFAVEMSYGP